MNKEQLAVLVMIVCVFLIAWVAARYARKGIDKKYQELDAELRRMDELDRQRARIRRPS